MLDWLKKEVRTVDGSLAKQVIADFSSKYVISATLLPRLVDPGINYTIQVWYHFGSTRHVLTVSEDTSVDVL